MINKILVLTYILTVGIACGDEIVKLDGVPLRQAAAVYAAASGRPLVVGPDSDATVTVDSGVAVSTDLELELLAAVFESSGFRIQRGKRVDRLCPVAEFHTDQVPLDEAAAYIRLDHALPVFAASLVRSSNSVGGVSVDVDARQHAVLIRGSSNAVATARLIIADADRAIRTVTVEAIVTEVDLATNDASGVDIFQRAIKSLGSGIAGGVQGSVAGQSAAPVSVLSALPSPQNIVGNGALWYTVNGLHLDVLLKFLSNDSEFRILSKPVMTVMDGSEASLSMGQQVPYVSQASSYNSGSTVAAVSTGGLAQVTASSVTFLDLSTTLKIRPRIGADGLVELSVEQDADSLGGYAQLPVGPVPIANTRKMSTVTQIRSGAVSLLGGLISSNSGLTSEGVPGLRKVPLLGGAFGERSRTFTKSELLVFVRVTINTEGGR